MEGIIPTEQINRLWMRIQRLMNCLHKQFISSPTFRPEEDRILSIQTSVQA